MADSYVTSGATIKCSCGDKTAKLTVYPDRTVFLTEKPMANISDHVSMYNIAPFGKCHTTSFPPTGSATAANHGTLTPMPCMPGTISDWLQGKDDYIIKGKPALLKSSYCKCQWGGIITITNDGQTDTGDVDLNRFALKSEEEILKKQEEEELAENAKLDVNSVLDGIQTALDLAGFAPGVGAAPDLLNAAISACRGNWAEAGLSVLAAVPLVGDVAAGVKLAKRGVKMAKSVNLAKKVYDTEKLSKMAKRSIGKNVDVSIKGLMSRGMTKDEAVFFRRSVQNERKEFARKFYEESGYKKTEIDGHLRGIDFEKPITIENVPPPYIFYQYQSIRNGKFSTGSYYSIDKNAQPTDLGIYDCFVFRKNGRQFKKFHREINNIKPQRALISTAYGATDDWSVPGKLYKTKGGAIQYFMPVH